MSELNLSLVHVDSENWNDIAVLEVSEKRMEFTASGSYYLCLCHYDGMWTPMAALKDGEVAGFIMWAEEEENGGCWLGGLMVDGEQEDSKLGEAIISDMIEALELKGYKEFFMSCTPGDDVLADILKDLGFADTGKEEDGEKILRLAR